MYTRVNTVREDYVYTLLARFPKIDVSPRISDRGAGDRRRSRTVKTGDTVYKLLGKHDVRRYNIIIIIS